MVHDNDFYNNWAIINITQKITYNYYELRIRSMYITNIWYY